MSSRPANRSRRPLRPRVLALGLLSVALLVWVVLFYRGGGGEKIRHPEEPAPAAKPSSAVRTPAQTRTVTLYFVSETDSLLHPEGRDIPASGALSEEVSSVLAELVKGSRQDLVAPLPPETKVRQVFVTADGVAYVDFSREIMEAFAYGSSSELAAVYAVVDTLTANFPPIKKVAILIEGLEKETLGGHVDLSRPLPPDASLIAK